MRGYISPDSAWCLQPASPLTPATNVEPTIESPELQCRIFPNPTTGRFTIEFTEWHNDETAIIELRGIHGELVTSQQIRSGNKYIISVENRPTGVYFLRVISGKTAQTFKIVKKASDG
jgi:hypothetical protein